MSVVKRSILLIPDPDRIEESMQLAEEYGAGFEYNDFYEPKLMDDEEAFQKRIRFYQDLPRNRSDDTLHGAFYDVTIHSDDPLIREISRKRVYQCMEAAEELGVRGVVFHTALIPNFTNAVYTEAWLTRSAAFWREVRRAYPEISIFIENMFDQTPVRLVTLMKELKDDAGIGVCFDVAHAHVFGRTENTRKDETAAWINALAPYIRHIHVNDNHGVEDNHEAVGDGAINWQCFSELISRSGIQAPVLIETRSLDRQRRSLAFMKTNGIYPF